MGIKFSKDLTSQIILLIEQMELNKVSESIIPNFQGLKIVKKDSDAYQKRVAKKVMMFPFKDSEYFIAVG